MASVKELNAKIASLKNTQKMTKTMKLVSASKMRRAQQAQENAHDYAVMMRRLLAGVAAANADADHVLLRERQTIGHAHVIFIVSDRGLCGGFNNHLCRFVSHWIEDQRSAKAFQTLSMSCCGRRGYAYFRRRLDDVEHLAGLTDPPRYASAAELADALMAKFVAGTYDAVYVANNEFKSALSQIPTMRRLLPIQPDTKSAPGDYLFEPQKDKLLELLLPTAVRFQLFDALIESAAGEQAARMAAMDSATNNATDMIDRYTLLRNRERQAVITRELIEIVTGAESL